MSSIFIAVKQGKLVTGAKNQAAFMSPETLSRSIGQKENWVREDGKYKQVKIKKGDYQIIQLDLDLILSDLKEKGLID
jgi:hypothetical protein